MEVVKLKEAPRNVRFHDDLEPYLNKDHVKDVAEIFNTPLTGSYNWDYTDQDNLSLIHI